MRLVDNDNNLLAVASFDERVQYKGIYLEELNIVLLKDEVRETHLCLEASAGKYLPNIEDALKYRVDDNYIKYTLVNSILTKCKNCRLPDLRELEFIFNNLYSINTLLQEIGGTPVNGMYWSRTLISPTQTWGKVNPDICITLNTIHSKAKTRLVYDLEQN